MYYFRTPSVDTGLYTLYGILPTAGAVSAPDPLYLLLGSSGHVIGSLPGQPVSELVAICARTYVDDLPFDWETHRVTIDDHKVSTVDCKDLRPTEGFEKLQRFSILGTRASINYAYQNREKHCEHWSSHGAAYAASRGADSTFRRNEKFIEFGDTRVYGVSQYLEINSLSPAISNETDVNVLGMRRNLNGVAYIANQSISRYSGQPDVLVLATDVIHQLQSIGLIKFGDGNLPSFGTLGEISPTEDRPAMCLHSIEHHVEDTTLVFTYTLERWMRNQNTASHFVWDIEFCIDGSMEIEQYLGLVEENTKGSIRTSWRCNEKIASWNIYEDGDLSTWDKFPDQFTDFPARVLSVPFMSYVVRSGITPHMRPRKVKVFHDLATQWFEKDVRRLANSPTVANALFAEWIEKIEQDIRNLTDTNVIETQADVRELQSLIPPIDVRNVFEGNFIDRFKALAKFVGSAVLYHNFVFQPTVGEIEVYTEAVREYTAPRIAKLDVVEELLYTRGSIQNYFEDDGVHIRTSFKSCWVPPDFRSVYEALGADILRQANFANYYDTIPFSWFLDYYSNLGDTIANFDAVIHNMTAWPLYSVKSHKSTKGYDANELFTSTSPSDHWLGTLTLSSFIRSVALQPFFPVPVIEGQNNLTASRLSNIGAVVVNFL